MCVEPVDSYFGGFRAAFAVNLKVSSGEDLIFGGDVVFHNIVNALAMLPVIHQLFLIREIYRT